MCRIPGISPCDTQSTCYKCYNLSPRLRTWAGPAKIISSINIADNEDNDRDDRNCTGAGGGEEDGSGHQTLLSTRPIMTESGNNFLIIDPGTSPSLIQSKIWTIIIHSIHSNDIV